MIEQLLLFHGETIATPPTPERWLYPMCTRFDSGDSGLDHIAASSEEEARAIAADQLRAQGIPFRAVACCLGTYWCQSLDGYPLRRRSPIPPSPPLRPVAAWAR